MKMKKKKEKVVQKKEERCNVTGERKNKGDDKDDERHNKNAYER